MSSLDPATAEAPDPSILRAERRLRLLEELSEIGMDLARALRREVLAKTEQAENISNCEDGSPGPSPARATPAAKGPDPADAFARISRAVRLTLSLEAKTDEALRALRAGLPVEAEARREEAARRAESDAETRKEDLTAKVHRLVVDVIDREAADPGEAERVEDALDERLEDDEAYAHLVGLPLRETVQRLCDDLLLTPDWSRWTGDDWAPREPFFRPKWSEFWEPNRRSLDNRVAAGPAKLE